MSHKNYHRESQDSFSRPSRRSSRGGARREDNQMRIDFLNMQAEIEKLLADKEKSKN